MTRWKTLIPYLVQWNVAGIKTIELSNWVWKWLIVPRASLKELKERREATSPAIYLLFWKNLHQQDIVYIGKAENLYDRLSTHDNKKDFWNLVIAFISKDNNLTKGDIKYLEARSIQKAKQAKVFLVENSVEPKINNLPEYQIDTMEDFLDNIELLISFLGYPILTEVKIESLKKEVTYICKGPSALAQWTYLPEGFVVYKNSLARKNLAKASLDWWVKNLQSELIAKEVIKSQNEESFVFSEDYIFSSPSAAAALILGRSANWWNEWKNTDGKTLNDTERKSLI